MNPAEIIQKAWGDPNGMPADLGIVCFENWPAVYAALQEKDAAIDALIRERQDLRAELIKTLADAKADIESWAAYADEYYQLKWHLSRDLARYADRYAELTKGATNA